MGEEKKEVRTFEVNWRCNVCKLGFCRALENGKVEDNLLTNRRNNLWAHECENCGEKVILDGMYPHIRYEKKEEKE